MNERAVRCIVKYPASTSIYTDLPDGNICLSTRGVVYNPNKEKSVKFYVDDNFPGGCDQAEDDNE